MATISPLKPDQKIYVNGKEVTNDQPVKISKIEIIENSTVKVNQKTDAEIKTETNPNLNNQIPNTPDTSKQQKTNQIKPATTPATETKKITVEDSIATPDYIQQSELN